MEHSSLKRQIASVNFFWCVPYTSLDICFSSLVKERSTTNGVSLNNQITEYLYLNYSKQIALNCRCFSTSTLNEMKKTQSSNSFEAALLLIYHRFNSDLAFTPISVCFIEVLPTIVLAYCLKTIPEERSSSSTFYFVTVLSNIAVLIDNCPKGNWNSKCNWNAGWSRLSINFQPWSVKWISYWSRSLGMGPIACLEAKFFYCLNHYSTSIPAAGTGQLKGIVS